MINPSGTALMVLSNPSIFCFLVCVEHILYTYSLFVYQREKIRSNEHTGGDRHGLGTERGGNVDQSDRGRARQYDKKVNRIGRRSLLQQHSWAEW